jgi:hypothetical protein
MLNVFRNLVLKIFPLSKCLSSSQIESMKEVITYLYDNEAKDYYYQKEDGKDVSEHIFNYIVEVDRFLSKKYTNKYANND